jgi:uncharacterized protein
MTGSGANKERAMDSFAQEHGATTQVGTNDRGALPQFEPLTLDQLRARLGFPAPKTDLIVQNHIDFAARAFIERSPFVCIATADNGGNADCSPRGGPPGFVRIVDEKTLLIPDFPGNKLLDTYVNLVASNGIGMLFLVPGCRESCRVNGRVRMTDHPAILDQLRERGKVPLVALVIDVEQAYIHCGKAMIRSGLWEEESRALAQGLPSMAQVLKKQLKDFRFVPTRLIEHGVAKDYKDNLF